MSKSTRRAVIVACCLAALLVAAGCTGDDEPSLPRVSADESSSSASPSPSGTVTSTPSSTTPSPTEAGPAGADLDRAQKSAYENAVEDYEEVRRVVRALNANPAANQATADQLKRVTYNPASDKFFESIQRYSRAKVRVVGDDELIWRSPVRVDLGARPRATVVWRQCLGLGTTEVLYGASPIPQKDDRTLGEVTALADENGFWRVSNVQSKGEC